MKNGAILLLLALPVCFFSFSRAKTGAIKRGPVPVLTGEPYIIIDKSDYELRVYDDLGWYATYPAVFGNKSLGDKMMEGDRQTPEGEYKIVSKRPHEKWCRILLINYPTSADWKKFKARKAKGVIPAGASIGGGIGIHGTWKRDEMAVDYFQNWTNGCISVKNEEIEELYDMIPVGTKVIIQK